jgi:DNA polymerase family A
MSRRDVIIDSESEWSEQVSIRNMCMRRYMALSNTYLWSVVTDGYRWAGTTEEFRTNYEAHAIICSKDSNVWAAQSNFDREWFEHDFPDLARQIPNGWQCLLDYASSHQRPRSLEHLHKALTGKAHSKKMRNVMKGVHFDEVLSFEQDYMKEYNLSDGDVGLEDLGELRKLGPMSPTEIAIASHTRMICRRGMAMDPEYIEKCRQALVWIRHNVEKQLPWVKDGDSPMEVQAFNVFCCNSGVAPPSNLRKGDEDFTDWMAANPKLAPTLLARQRYELANRKIQHIEKFLSRCFEGIYYPDLLYCGAPHTRRFSSKGASDGSQTDDDSTHSGFNIQNMDREPIFGDLLPDFVSPLPPVKGGKPLPGIFVRNFLVPRPGKKFVIWDFSQIEPRCLAWLVGAEDFLDMVRNGFSVYEAHARARLGWTGGDLKSENADLYRMAKAQVLGLGYGCGIQKFPAVAWSMARLRITHEESEKAVYGYRRDNPGIAGNGWNGGPVGIWSKLQRLCVEAAKSTDPLEIDLPNGETMRYFGVEQYTRYDEQGKGRFCYKANKVLGDPNPKGPKDIYGGKLTENVTQRFARDLLAEAILRIERAGMPVCFHSHDELIAEVDTADAKDAYIEGTRLMEIVPEWAAGLPIGASGGVYDRYCKAD